MPDSLPEPGLMPVRGWESENICYQHLIRPVVALIRDHGPVPVVRVQDFIESGAYGDVRFASPTRDRRDGAERAFNLLVQDLGEVSVTDGLVSVPADLTTVTSDMFGPREVPAEEHLRAEQEATQRQHVLREWVTRDLFRTKWHDGIRKHGDDEIAWMAEQIRQYGFVGPKIVRDADTGAIISGGLRAAALRLLDMPLDDYVETVQFANDRHRLAYFLAEHTTPGGKTRLPVALRDSILREILPYKSGVLRTPDGRPMEPTAEDWLMITGMDFTVSKPILRLVEQSAADGVATPVSERVVIGALGDVLTVEWAKGRPHKEILTALLRDDDFRPKSEILADTAALGVTSERLGRTLRDMEKEGILYVREVGGRAEYRLKRIAATAAPDAPAAPTAAPKRKRDSRTPRQIWLDVVTEWALAHPGQRFKGSDLDAEVQLRTGGAGRARPTWHWRKQGLKQSDVNGRRWLFSFEEEKKSHYVRARPVEDDPVQEVLI